MIEQILNHSEIAIDQLLAQFKEKPKIDALIRMQTDQIQDLENAAFSLHLGRHLQIAAGAVLDRWGGLLDEPRQGRSDEAFRAALYFKITRNLATGTPDSIVEIFKILTGSTFVEYREEYPATIYLTGFGIPEETNVDLLYPYILAAKPAGVRLGGFLYSKKDPVFGFLGYPYPNLAGIGDLNDPSVGGFFVSTV